MTCIGRRVLPLLLILSSGCAVAPPADRPARAPAGEAAHLEKTLRSRTDILFFSGFETDPWPSAWGLVWGPSPAQNLTLVADGTAHSGRSARVRYPKGLIGGDSACQFYSSFRNLGIGPLEEAYVRYYVRFDPGFEFVKGGKLPGLVGGEGNTGAKIPDGRDGWSARLMWRTGGRVVQYVYHPDQPGKWGEDLPWTVDGEPCHFQPGKWHCVETRVKMNAPAKKDGVIESWFDGKPALRVETLRFRDVPELAIDAFYFSTFFGGGEPDWAPSSDQYVQFDSFVIAADPVGP